jgi:hypothetical protein
MLNEQLLKESLNLLDQAFLTAQFQVQCLPSVAAQHPNLPK